MVKITDRKKGTPAIKPTLTIVNKKEINNEIKF